MLPTGQFGLPYNTPPTDRVQIFTGGVGTISFDVTADVQRFLAGTLPTTAGFSPAPPTRWAASG